MPLPYFQPRVSVTARANRSRAAGPYEPEGSTVRAGCGSGGSASAPRPSIAIRAVPKAVRSVEDGTDTVFPVTSARNRKR